MTGLSSVAGTPLQAKVQTSSDTVVRSANRGVTAGLMSSGQAVITLLRSAVEAMAFSGTEADRKRTDTGVQPEAAQQTPTQDQQTAEVGQNLDVTA